VAPRLDTGLSRFELSVAPLSKLSLPPAVMRDLETPVGEDGKRKSRGGGQGRPRRSGELTSTQALAGDGGRER